MSASRKIIWIVVGIVVIGLVILLVANSSENNGPVDNGDNHIIIISQEGSFTSQECEARGLAGKVIMLESAYCHACQSTKPTFLAACEAKGVIPIILDLAEAEDYAQMESYKINIQFTPTFIFGCDYYIGTKSQSDYENYLDKFLTGQ